MMELRVRDGDVCGTAVRVRGVPAMPASLRRAPRLDRIAGRRLVRWGRGGGCVDTHAGQHVACLLGLRPHEQVTKFGERDPLLFEELRDVAQGVDRGFQLDVLVVGERRMACAVDEACDERYNYASGLKANRLRGFWTVADNRTVGKLLGDLLDHGRFDDDDQADLEICRRAATRLSQDTAVPEIDALTAPSDERDFEIVAKAVREAIDKNTPESGLDRLHTFVVKYVRGLCAGVGVAMDRDKALHSLFGEYVKKLREAELTESEMTLRILKSSISTLEAFNDVRNNKSLAHDNPVLNYDEALLIFNHVAASIRFLRSLERKGGAASARR